jgi:hypothetical protein
MVQYSAAVRLGYERRVKPKILREVRDNYVIDLNANLLGTHRCSSGYERRVKLSIDPGREDIDKQEKEGAREGGRDHEEVRDSSPSISG